MERFGDYKRFWSKISYLCYSNNNLKVVLGRKSHQDHKINNIPGSLKYILVGKSISQFQSNSL